MRLFTAIALGKAEQHAIQREQARLARSLGNPTHLRLLRPDQFHVTLVFIGEVDSERARAITEAMKTPLACPPFRIAFGGAGFFPERGAPRVLWLGLHTGRGDTVALQHQVAQRLASVGVPLEARPFDPHVTLGRWKESRSADRKGVSPGRAGIAGAEVRDVTLFESRMSSKGSTYTAIAQSPLTVPA